MGLAETIREAIQWLVGLQSSLLRSRHLSHLVVIAGLVTLASGVMLFLIDPSIRSLFDGVWYAWVTMTHVGYGDVVPTSLLGRALAALLILFGLGLFALFTATFSAALIGEGIGRVDRELDGVARDTHSIQRGEDLILTELRLLNQRLERLEQHLNATSRIESRRSGAA